MSTIKTVLKHLNKEDLATQKVELAAIDDLKELAILQDIKSDSLIMMLQYSPLFYRIDKGFYTLIGKKMDN